MLSKISVSTTLATQQYYDLDVHATANLYFDKIVYFFNCFRECICPHAESYFDKFQCLVFMLQKLFSVVQNDSLKDSVDGPMMQELLLGGHLYLQVMETTAEGEYSVHFSRLLSSPVLKFSTDFSKV